MHDERRYRLESFARGPALLSATLDVVPKRMWLYRAADDGWTIHEIIIHLADKEVTGYLECRRIVAEPKSPVLTFDGRGWANRLGYFQQSFRDALTIIRRLRRATYRLLCTVPEQVWGNKTSLPDASEVSLEHWVTLQERHIPYHIDQIQQIFKEWTKARHLKLYGAPSPKIKPSREKAKSRPHDGR